MHCRETLGDHPFPVNKKLKDIGVYPPSGANHQHIETVQTDDKETYMVVTFLSVLNRHRYGLLMNEIHNEFRMGWDEYPKTLKNTYDLAINFKGDTGSVSAPQNGGVEIVTEGQDGNLHTT